MRNLLHHPAKTRRVRPLHYLVEFAQPQAANDDLVFFRRADRTAHQLDLDFGSHDVFSAVRPRISAIAALSRNCSSAATAAFTTLWGLCVPMDLVSTLGIPAA